MKERGESRELRQLVSPVSIRSIVSNADCCLRLARSHGTATAQQRKHPIYCCTIRKFLVRFVRWHFIQHLKVAQRGAQIKGEIVLSFSVLVPREDQS